MCLFNVLAQVDYAMRLKGLRGGFRPNEGAALDIQQIFSFLLLMGSLVIALLIVRTIYQRRTSKRHARKPTRLFAYALKQMGIATIDRVLLRIAAKNCDLKQPALMLFSPDLLERYAGRWADSISVRPVRNRVKRRIRNLAQKAFEQSDAAPQPPITTSDTETEEGD